MVAIVSGSSAGLNLSGSTPFGRRGNLGQPAQGASGDQAYVNIANGNLVLQHLDANAFGRGPDLSLLRTYNSQGAFTDDNADGWWINGYRRVVGQTGTVNTAGSTVQRVDSDGSVLTYTYNATAGNYQAAAGSGRFNTLSYNATSAQWTWTEAATQNKEVYGASGATWRLLSQSDANGNTTSYAYTGNLLTGVTDANGESIELIYSGNNLAQERIKQADGTYVSNTYYRYDAQNRLAQVKLDLSPTDNSIGDGAVYVTSYGYVGATNLVSSVTQTDGTELNLTYVNVGGQNRVASMTDALGRVTAFSYDVANRKTVVTDPLGNTTTYVYDTANRYTSITGPTAGGVVQQMSYLYDAAGNLARSTDAQGNYTAWVYDSHGNLLTQTDNLGNRLERTYNAANQVLTSTVYRTPAAGSTAASAPATTRYVYDALNNPRFVITPEGRVSEFRYDAFGQRTSAVGYPAAAYSLTGLAVGQAPALATMVGWAAAQTQGQTTRADYVYNVRGQLAGATTYATMNADGTGVKDGSESTAAYAYDVGGHLLSVVDANKKQTSYVYDGLGRVLSTTDALGHVTLNQYDDADHTLIHKQANGRVDTAIFNRAGELLASIQGGVARTEYRYDGLGRMILSIDPTGVKQFTVYDAAGRVQAVVDGRGDVTQYLYNALGQAVQTVRHSVPLTPAQMTQLLGATSVAATATPPAPAATVLKWSAATSYAAGAQVVYGGKLYQASAASANAEPDGVNGLWTEVALAGQTRTWSPTAKYALNDTVTFNGATYKALRVTQGATPNLAASADWSLVTAATAPAFSDQSALWPIVAGDASSFNLYDQAGRLAKTVDAMGHVTERQYDGAGNLVAVTARATTVATTGLSKTSTPASVTVAASNLDRTVYNYYNLDNQLVASIDGERYVTQYRYDNAGRPVEAVRYATAVVSTVALSPATAPATFMPAANAADQHSYTLYDAEGRTVGTVDAEGYLTELSYDANGNRTGSRRYATKTGAAATATSTLASLRPAAAGEDQFTSASYDALNRVIGAVNAEGAVSQYVYDIAGNLITVTSALGTADARVASQRYDALGRLTATLSGNGAALLVSGQTQAQIDAVWAQYGTTYAYDNAGRRVSSTDPNGARTLFYYDQAGNLTHTIDAMGEVRERRYDAFNQLTATVRYGTRLAQPAALAGGLADAALATALGAIVNAALDSKSVVAYNLDGTVNAATDELGGATTYVYDAFGDRLATTIAIASGKSLALSAAYDHRGLQTVLVSDAAAANVAQTNTYDAFGRVVRRVDGNGNITQFSFDRLGRAVTSIDGATATRRDSYDAFGRVLTHTDALGDVTSYAYDRAARSVTMTTPEGIQLVTARTLQGQTASVVDGNGNRTTYAYDRDGNLLTTTTALTTTKSVYDRADRLVQTVDANGKTVGYTYDAANRLLTRVVDSAGLALTTSYQYDAKGQQISVTDPAGVVTVLTYDLKGQVLSQTVDPTGLNAVTRYTYDARGKRLTVTSPAGNVVQYVYDNLGRRIEEHVDPAGLNLVRRYTYDKDDNVVSATDADGNLTRYAYDADNRRVYTVDPLGAVQKNTYDAEGRVTAVTAYSAAISLISFGPAVTVAQVAARVVPAAGADKVEARVYDKDNRLRYSIDGLGGVTAYVYDKNGNVVDSTAYAKRIVLANWTAGTTPAVVADAAHDRRVRTVYDALDRALFSVAGTGAVTAYKYDANGNVVDRVAYSKLIPPDTAMTAAAIGAAAALVANASVDRHVRMVYDGANRLALSADGVGAVTQYVYDKDGRVVKQVAYATAIGAAVAPSAVAASANDRVTLFAYDTAGRLAYQVDTLGGVDRMVYDANGNLVQRVAYAKPITAPTTATAAPTAAALAAAVVADAANDRIDSRTYDGAGRLVFSVDAVGAVSELRYDAAGQVIATVAYATPVALPLAAGFGTASVRALLKTDAANDRLAQRAYDAAGQLVYTVDPLGNVRRNTYDALGRLTAATAYAKAVASTTANTVAAIGAAVVADAADETTAYRYDNAGELVGTTDALGRTEQYTYDGVGNRLSFVNKAGATWNYAYDSAGRLLTEVSPPVAITGMTTDANGNLVAPAAANLNVVTAMNYDALGNLVARTEAAGRPEQRSTAYVYDALGRQTMTILPPVANYNEAEDPTTNGASALAARSETTVQLKTQTFYDALGNAVMNRDVAGNYSYKTYDRAGHVVYDVDALGYVTGYQRNAFGEAAGLTRYALAPATGLAAGTARTTAALVAALATLNHGADRAIVTTFDRLGRAATVTEPASWVSNGTQGAVAAKVTRNTYNGLGQLVQQAVLADAANSTWATTSHFFDRDGRETLTVDAMGYATGRNYDALGNVTRVIEYANALASAAPTTAATPTSSVDDRFVTYAYDKLNRLVTQTRLNIQFSDGTTDVTAGTRTRGSAATTYAYDAVGNRTAVTDALGSTTYTYYDALGRVRAVALPVRSSTVAGTALTPLTEFLRDALGNVTVKIDYANGAASATATAYTAGAASADDHKALARYDSHGDVVQNVDANGVSHYASYDANGNVRKQWQAVTGNDGVVHTLFTVYKYDALGRRVTTVTPASTSQVSGSGIANVTLATAGLVQEQIEYNAFGEMVRQGTNGGRQTYFDFDNAGHLWRTNSGDGVDKVFIYNLLGQQTTLISNAGLVNGVNLGTTALSAITSAQQAEQLAGMRRTTSQVDLLGRVLTLTLPDRGGARPVIKQTFDRWGNVLSRGNLYAANSVTTFNYNANNQIIFQREPDGSGAQSTSGPTTQTYYDRLGRQIAVRDANGNVSNRTYDRAGNLVQEQHADGGIVTHYWNAFGQQNGARDANGNLTTYVLDHMGRVLQSVSPAVGKYSVSTANALSGASQQLITASAYDQAGRLLWRTTPNGEKTSYDYDLRGNTVGVHLPMGQIQRRAYDISGRVVGALDANGKLATWTYDSFGLLTARRDIGGATYSYAYDAARQLTTQTSSGGQSLAYRYDGAGQQIEVHDTVLDKFVLTSYNAAGQKTREQTIQKNKRYQDSWSAYNAQGLLARVDSPKDGLSVLMNYDNMGNIVHQQTVQTAHGVSTASENMVIDGATHTVTQEISAATARTENLWYAYDSMQRQLMIEGGADGNAANNANLTATQGHRETYDKNGNRISDTSWGLALVVQIVNGTTTYVRHTGLITHYYQYDAANRLVSTSLAAYDSAWNALPVAQAVVVDQRFYDGDGQLVQSGAGPAMPAAYRNALALAANASLASQYATSQKRYDANGRLLSEHVTELNGTLRYDTTYGSYDLEGNPLAYSTLDATGARTDNTIVLQALDGYKRQTITSVKTAADGSKTTSSTGYSYDKNGLLTGTNVTLANGTSTARGYVNDANGNIVQSLENGKTMNRLLADGHLLETWAGTSTATPQTLAMTTGGTGTTAATTQSMPVATNEAMAPQVARQRLSASMVSTSSTMSTESTSATTATATTTSGARVNYFDESGNAIVAVKPGDTLQSLAQAAYGNADLWYLIADANGIATNSDLSHLGSVKIPTSATATVTSSATGEVTSSSTTVYHSTDGGTAGISESDFWNLVPGQPGHGGGGCGGLGKVLVMVVAVAVSFVAGPIVLAAMEGVMGAGLGATIAAGAVTGAAASAASQVVGIGIGEQSGFNWKGVALGAIAGGVSAGIGPAASAADPDSFLGGLAGPGVMETAGRAAVGNVVTQGVEVAVGLQDHFSWTGVAAAAAGAGAGAAVGGAVSDALGGDMGAVGTVISHTASGVASSVASTIVTGGHIDVGNILTDAFGNAVAGALVGGILAPPAGSGDGSAGPGVATGGGGDASGADDFGPVSVAPVELPDPVTAPIDTGSLDDINGGMDDRGLLNAAEQSANPDYYSSVAGHGQVAAAGDNISKLLGTSDPQAVGNFMRANGLSNSNLYAGQNYFIPDDPNAYGDSSGLGQGTLNTDNARLQQIAAQQAAREAAAAADLQRAASGGVAPSGAPGVQMVEQMTYDYLGVPTGSQMVPVDNRPPMPYGEQMSNAGGAMVQIGIGALKGVVNGVPALLTSVGKGYAYLGALIGESTGLLSDGATQRTIDMLDSHDGRPLPSANGLQAMGGVVGELFSPGAYAKGAQLGMAGLTSLAPMADTIVTNYMQRTGGILYAVPESGVSSSASSEVSNVIRTGPVQALEVDSYNSLRSRAVVGDELEHDHIPSFAALRTAKEAELDRALTPAEKQALYNNATAIESPRDIHLDSRTFGGRNTPEQIQLDASDLNAAAQRDLARLRTNFLNKGYDPASVDQAVNQVLKRNVDLGIGPKK